MRPAAASGTTVHAQTHKRDCASGTVHDETTSPCHSMSDENVDTLDPIDGICFKSSDCSARRMFKSYSWSISA